MMSWILSTFLFQHAVVNLAHAIKTPIHQKGDSIHNRLIGQVQTQEEWSHILFL